MRTPEGEKYLPAERLVQLLLSLPSGASVMPNTVGNLLVMSKDWEYIGFVDFAGDGGVELFEQEQ